MGGHAVSLDPAKLQVPATHGLRKVPAIALGVAAVGLVASLVLGLTGLGGEHGLKNFYFSYLVAFVYFFTLGCGGLFFVLVNRVAKAGWSVTLRRIAENLAGTLPWMAPLFIPVLVGMHELYHWTHVEHHDAILAAKAPWLNEPFFIGRAVFVLVALGWMGWWFRRESVIQDQAGERDVRLGPTRTTSTRRLSMAAGPCVFLFALALTLAAFDWVMSLEPHWYSTIFGGYLFAGSVLAILALLIVLGMTLQRGGLLGKAVTAEHYHDLGKFLFAFVVFWGYIAFSQFMLIWYANIPEEQHWYHMRMQGSWTTITKVILFGHFLLPFFFLIQRRVKRHRGLLFGGAAYLLLIHLVDIYWIIMPTGHRAGFQPSLLDLATLLFVGGVFVHVFARLTLGAALVPVKDPRLEEALAFENF